MLAIYMQPSTGTTRRMSDTLEWSLNTKQWGIPYAHMHGMHGVLQLGCSRTVRLLLWGTGVGL